MYKKLSVASLLSDRICACPINNRASSQPYTLQLRVKPIKGPLELVLAHDSHRQACPASLQNIFGILSCIETRKDFTGILRWRKVPFRIQYKLQAKWLRNLQLSNPQKRRDCGITQGHGRYNICPAIWRYHPHPPSEVNSLMLFISTLHHRIVLI